MPKTIKDFLAGYDNWQPPADMWGYQPTATRSNAGMYSWGNMDTGMHTLDPYQELYSAIARGEVLPTAEDWSQMFSTNNGIDAQEWATLSPEVRAWAQANPQAFMQQVLAMRNKANGDLLSMGAEGGFQNLDRVGLANGRMDYSNAGYMDINDEWYDSMDFWGPMLVGAFAGAAGAGWLGGAGSTGQYATVAEAIAAGDYAAADAMATQMFNAGNTLAEGAGVWSASNPSLQLMTSGYDTAGMDSLVNAIQNNPSWFEPAAESFIDPTTGLQYAGNGLGQGQLTEAGLQAIQNNPSWMQQLIESPIGTAAKALGLTNADGSLNLGSMLKAGLLTAGALGAGGAISNLAGGNQVGGVTNDWIGAANATAEGNWQNILRTSQLNHPNMTTPQGSVTWEYNPATGQWSSRTSLNAGEQALYDQSIESGLMRGDLINQAMWNNADTLTQGVNWDALPQAPINPGTTAYDAIMARLEPQLAREQQSLDSALANSGFDPGSAGWAAKQQLFGQNRNDLRLNAAKEAIGLDTTARQNAFNEQVTGSQLPLKNIATLMGLGQQSTYQQPNFGPTWTPASTTPGADLLGAMQMQSTQQMNNQNLSTATRNANLSGLVGVGSALLGSNGFWNWLG